MNRAYQTFAALMLTLLMVPALGLASPVIFEISQDITSANTGVTIDITGSGFGDMDDRVYFPSYGMAYVNPVELIPDGIRVRVPLTWSGDLYVVDMPGFYWSQPFNHDITFSYAGYKWQYGSFTWRLNVNAAPGCTYTNVKNALVNGYNAWTCASDANTTYGGSTTTAETANDGENCRYWRNSGWDDSNVVATATTFFNTQTHLIHDADIAFNSQHHCWTTTGASGCFDVGNIGTHEEGHTLGLKDLYGTADVGKTMLGYGDPGFTNSRSLHTHDAYGVEYMYPHYRANFDFITPSGWSFPLVPRNTNNSSSTYCDLPFALGGNTTTYFNFAATNNGYDCTAPRGSNDLYVDGIVEMSPGWTGVWNPDVDLTWTNFSYHIRGGRHTLMSVLDSGFETVETSETDNVLTYQFVWNPLVLEDQVPVMRDVPPHRGYMTYPNCDGFEFSTGGNWWAVVGNAPINGTDDYDLRLHNETPNSTNGFDQYVASSTMSGETVDFVVVNGNNGGGADITRWVGQNRWNDGAYEAYIELCQSVELLSAPVTSPLHFLNPGNFVKMHEVYFSEPGTYQFALKNSSPDPNLSFALYDESGTHFSRQNYLAMGDSQGNGEDEYFFYEITEAGYYGIVVFKTVSVQRLLNSAYRLEILLDPPNLTYYTAPGWDYPVVPRNDNTATDTNTHVSSILDGETYNTHFSVSGINDSSNSAEFAHTKFYVDETFYTNFTWGEVGPQVKFRFNNYGPTLISGGRHTAEWRIDEDDEILEWNEDDNIYLHQYIWSPLVLSNASPVNRGAPPVRGSGAFHNCDGLSLTPIPQYAWVAISCPLEAGDDYDLTVYNDYSGPESGFSQYFMGSTASAGHMDYVAGAYTTAGMTRYPAVTRYSGGSGHVVVDNASSNNHMASTVPVSWNDVSMGSNKLVEVFEVQLTGGDAYAMQMTNTDGTANLNVFAHKPSDLSMNRFNAEFSWMAGGPGEDEGGTFTPSESGYYVFLVVKNWYADVPLSAEFGFSISHPLTPVSDEGSILPMAFALLGNHPNPFNPRTEISFAIPVPGASVRLDVFDLSGRRVRTIADRTMPAGVHRLTWDGRNNQGEAQNSGTYFYQLRAGSFSQTGKMTLLK